MIYRLLDEHAALIAGFAGFAGSEDSDNSEVHAVEEIVENSCNQYPEPDDMTSVNCINQETITTIDNLIESGNDDFEFSTSDSWDYEKDTATSFWAVAESDDNDDSCSDIEQSHHTVHNKRDTWQKPSSTCTCI